jgi:capsid protein
MAGILDRVASRLGYIPRPTPEPARLAKRRFEAAQSGRLFASWPAANTSLDYDLRASLAALRGRSRHLAQNNDYAQRFLQMCKTHVVGPAGFSLQAQSRFANGKVDQVAN